MTVRRTVLGDKQSKFPDLALMEGLGLDLPLLLQAINDVLVAPANLVGQTADSAVLAAGLQPQDTQSLGNDHLLLLVVGGRDTLEDLEALKGSGTAGGLVGDHAADGLVEDARGGAEVEGTVLFRVHEVLFVEEVVVAQL